MESSRKLRTLHVTHGDAWGGRQMPTLALVKGLPATGHRQVIAADAGSPIAQRAEQSGISVLAQPPGLLGRMLSLRRAAATEAWDSIHLHDVASLKDLGRACVGRVVSRRLLTVRGDVA